MKTNSFLRFCACLLLLIVVRPAAFAASGNDNPTGLEGGFSGSITTGCGYDAYTGSATRTVVDLEIPGAVSSYPLTWARTMNTRSSIGKLWKHSWSWSINRIDETIGVPYGVEPGFVEPTSYTVNFPDGRVIVFSSRDDVNDPYFHAPNGVPERLQQDATNKDKFYLLLPDGGKVYLERTKTFYTGVEGETGQKYTDQSVWFHFRSLIDPFGRTTTASYDTSDRLSKLTDPSTRYLSISYTVINNASYVNKVTGWEGQWAKFVYTGSSLTSVVYSDGSTDSESNNPTAVYTYQASNVSGVTGTLPLILKDIRYPGAMRDIKYEFATGSGAVFGQVKAEKKPASSETANADVAVSSYDLATHTETRGDAFTRSFTYSGYNLATSKDFEGKTTTYAYDDNGFQKSITEPKVATDPSAHTTTYEREAYAGQITKITYPDQTFSKVTYTDPNNPYWVKTVTDELNHVTTFTRDSSHRVTRIDYPATAIYPPPATGTNSVAAYETFTYNSFGQVLTHLMTNGETESFAYDSLGQRSTSKDALGKITYYYYNDQGRLFWITDPLNHSTSLAYNHRGQVTLRWNETAGTGVWFDYDVYGNELSHGDGLGHVSWWVYDGYNRAWYAANPLNQGTTSTLPFTYIAALPTQVSSPEGRITGYTYNKNLAPLTTTAGLGSSDPSTSSVHYDEAGRVDYSTDAKTNKSYYTYDARNRRLTAKDPLNHTTVWTYDAVGNVLTTQLADLTTTINTYDARNRLHTTKDPLNKIVTMDYDPTGNLTKLTDKNSKAYIFAYDELNRMRQETFPDTRYEASSWYDDGSVHTLRNRAGNIKTFSYNIPAHTVTSTWNANGETIVTTADDAGRVTDINGANSDLHYTYDDANRQLTEQQTIVGLAASKTLTYTYDGDGNRLTTKYPDGTVLANLWTPREELQKISSGSTALVTYALDDLSRPTTRTLAPGNSATYAYNTAGSLDMLTLLDGASIKARFDYGYNEINNRTYVKRLDGKGDAYTYDAAQQLTVVNYNASNVDTVQTGASANASYHYDAAGNRSSSGKSGTAGWTYTPNPNNTYATITGISPASTPTYDNDGNSKTWNGWTYVHNAEDKLTSADRSGMNADFYRDPLNRIVKKVVNGVSTYNIYDGWNVVAVYTTSGGTDTKIDQYVYGQTTDEIVRRVGNSNKTYYYQYDGLGSVSQVLDMNGDVAESYTYDAYGAATIISPTGAVLPDSAIGNRYLFTGREYITEIDLYDYRNRTYSAELGRFMEPDPLGFVGGDDNLYRYVENNPVNHSDPSGLIDRYDPDGHEVYNSNGINNPWIKLTGAPNPNPNWNSGGGLGSSGTLFRGGDGGGYSNTGSLTRGIGPARGLSAAIPFYGSGRNMINDFQNGNYIGGTFNLAMTVSDVFLLKAGVVALGKLGVEATIEAGAKEGIQFTKSSLNLGRETHATYKAGLADGITTFKEFTGIKGIRPDFVDFSTKTIFELKPFNPNAIQQGAKQLDKYKALFEQNYGLGWKTVLETY